MRKREEKKQNNGEVTEARRKPERRYSLWRHSPPVSVDAVLEVEHGQPPHVYVQHVIIDDVLRDKKKGEVRAAASSARLTANTGQIKRQLAQNPCRPAPGGSAISITSQLSFVLMWRFLGARYSRISTTAALRFGCQFHCERVDIFFLLTLFHCVRLQRRMER